MSKTRAIGSSSARPRRRWTPTEAMRVLAAQAESGLPVSVFAAREGLSAHRLFRWRSRLGASTPKPPTFEEVVPRKAPPTRNEPAPLTHDRLEIVLRSGLVVRVGESFSADALRRLLDVVGGERSC